MAVENNGFQSSLFEQESVGLSDDSQRVAGSAVSSGIDGGRAESVGANLGSGSGAVGQSSVGALGRDSDGGGVRDEARGAGGAPDAGAAGGLGAGTSASVLAGAASGQALSDSGQSGERGGADSTAGSAARGISGAGLVPDSSVGAGAGGQGLPEVAGTPVDFVPGGQVLVPSGAKARAVANLDAIELVKKLNNENRYATAQEQAVLARFSSWGATTGVFDENNAAYADVRARMQGLLSDEEIAQAREASLNAHFTDPAIVQAMWSVMERAGFDGGAVLEPGCGSGNFIGQSPASAQMIGVELDSMSAQIAHYLYPSATIYAEGYEKVRVPEQTIAVAVGNVPFGDYRLVDPVDNGEGLSIHNYFINKSMKRLAPGGYGAFITSAFTMDAKNAKARAAIAEHSDLVAAVRLPDHAFAEVAGTRVVTDILIFRRRAEGETPDRAQQAAEWVDGFEKTVEGETVRTSRFFSQNPNYVLGQQSLKTNQYGQATLGVHSPDKMPVISAKIREALYEQIAKAQATGLEYSPALVATADTKLKDFAPGGLRTLDDLDIAVEGTVRFNEKLGKIERYDALAGQWEAVKAGGRNGVSELEMRALLGLKEQTRRVLDAPTDEARASYLEELHQAYDKYVEQYGYINRFTLVQGVKPRKSEVNRRLREYRKLWLENQDTEGLTKAEIRELEPDEETLALWEAEANAPDSFRKLQNHLGFLKTDSDFGKLIALEDFDEEERVGQKSRLFEAGTYQLKGRATTAESPAEALSISLDETRSVDMGRISELLGVSEEEALNQLGNLVFKDPQDGQYVAAVGYLSGNVRVKLEAAEEAAALDISYQRNVDALKEVLPPWAGIEKIHLQVGASFMTQEQYRQFALDTFGVPLTITKSPDGTGWEVPHRNADMKPSVRLTYGTKRRGPADLLDAVMNNRQPKVFDKVKDPDTGRDKNVLNEKETKEARLKAAKIEYTFKKWVSSSPTRVAQVEKEFNRRFNSYVAPDYSVLGEHLALKGISPNFTPHPYQREAVARIVNEPSVLLDHVVGAGKTGSMIMGALELRNRGIAHKPLFVVPNHLVEQITREFTQWAPTAQVLMIPTGISAAERKVYAAKSLAGDWDAVIMPQSVFNRVGLSAGRQAQFLREDIDALLAQKVKSGDELTVKAIEKLVKRKETRMAELFARKDEGVSFEELGCDYLFVDEAHDFKNLSRVSEYQELACAGSMRASDLDFILRALREDKIEASGGLNRTPAVATFATGTPIANSLSELWVMMHYLRPDVLEDLGIASIDSWARVFTRADAAMEVQPSGLGFRIVNKVTEYENLPQLKQLNALFTSTVTRDQIPQKLPSIVGGAMRNITRDASEQVKEYMDEVVKKIENPGPDDYLIEVLGRARRVALDPRLVGLDADEDGGRPRLVAKEVMRIHEKYQDTEYLNKAGTPTVLPGGLQIIFCDQGAPGTDAAFNMYDAMKEELVAAGMPVDRIAYIHDAEDDVERAELFDRCRSGEVSVLIGSTRKMGTGMNVQQRLTAIHHADIPWKPADLEQREGRGIRQGNQNSEIEILSYGTRGTFDAYSWQVIARKLKALNQWKAGEGLDSMESLSGDGDPQMMIAWLTDNPALMEQLTLTVEVQRLLMEKNAETSSVKDLEFEITSTEARIAGLEQTLKLYRSATPHQAVSGVPLFLGERVFESRSKEAGDYLLRGLALLNMVGARSAGTFYQLGHVGNIPFVGQVDEITGMLNLRLVDPETGQVLAGSGHSVEPGKIAAGQVSGVGQLARLARAASTLDVQVEALEQRQQMLSDELVSLRARLSEAQVGFARQDELDEKLMRLEQLSADLGLDSLGDEFAGDSREDDAEAVLNDDEVELLYGEVNEVNSLREGDVIEIGSGYTIERGLYRVYLTHPVTGEKPRFGVWIYDVDATNLSADSQLIQMSTGLDFQLASRLYSAIDERDRLILSRGETDLASSSMEPSKAQDYVNNELPAGASVVWFAHTSDETGMNTVQVIHGTVLSVESAGYKAYEVKLLGDDGQEHTVLTNLRRPADFIYRDSIDLEAAAAAEEADAEAERIARQQVSGNKLTIGDMLLRDVQGVGLAGYIWNGRTFADSRSLATAEAEGMTLEKASAEGLLSWDDIAPGRVLDAEETMVLYGDSLQNALVADLRLGDVVDGQKLAPKSGVTEPVRIVSIAGSGTKKHYGFRKVSEPAWAEVMTVPRMGSSKVGAISERRFGALEMNEKCTLSDVEVRALDFENVPEETYGSWVSVEARNNNYEKVRHFGLLRSWSRGPGGNYAHYALDVDGEQRRFEVQKWGGNPTIYVTGTPDEIDWRGMPLGVDGFGASRGTGFESLRGFKVPDFGVIRELTVLAEAEVLEGEVVTEVAGLAPEPAVAETVEIEEPPVSTDVPLDVTMAVEAEEVSEPQVFEPVAAPIAESTVEPVAVNIVRPSQLDAHDEGAELDELSEVLAPGTEQAPELPETEVVVEAENLEKLRHDLEDATDGKTTVTEDGHVVTAGVPATSSVAVGVARSALKAAGYEQNLEENGVTERQVRPLNDLVAGDMVAIYPRKHSIAPAAPGALDLTSQNILKWPADENDVLVARLVEVGSVEDWNSHVFEAEDSRGTAYRFTLNTVFPVRELAVIDGPEQLQELESSGLNINPDVILQGYGSAAPEGVVAGDIVSMTGVVEYPNGEPTQFVNGLVLDTIESTDSDSVYFAVAVSGTVLEVEATAQSAVFLKYPVDDVQREAAESQFKLWQPQQPTAVPVEEVAVGDSVTIVGSTLDGEPTTVTGEATYVDAGTVNHEAIVQVEDATGQEQVAVVEQVLREPEVSSEPESPATPIEPESPSARLGENISYVGVTDLSVEDATVESGREPVTMRYGQVRAGDKITDGTGTWYTVYQSKVKHNGDVELTFMGNQQMFTTTMPAATKVTADPYPVAPFYGKKWEQLEATRVRAGDLLQVFDQQNKPLVLSVMDVRTNSLGVLVADVQGPGGLRDDFSLQPRELIRVKSPLCEFGSNGIQGAAVGTTVGQLEPGQVVQMRQGNRGVVLATAQVPESGKIRVKVQPLGQSAARAKVWDFEPSYAVKRLENHHGPEVAHARKMAETRARLLDKSPHLNQGPVTPQADTSQGPSL